ncbi:MAG: stationary phase survival protein SurE, partial [Clostridiales bacterium]|nr:stationary phase survival protein SurE [Clostridiales bacterium]
GLNCGTDILYSGTVSAAIEASIYNVPAIAFSMEVDWNKYDEDYTIAAKLASKIVDLAEDKYLKNNVVLNVNIPNLKEEEIKGIKVCKLGESTYKSEYVLIEDAEEKTYEIKSNRNKIEQEDTDLFYLSKGYITITPLHYDFTNFKMLEEVTNIFEMREISNGYK